MDTAEITSTIVALCIVAADFAVRLFIIPHKKDPFLEDLLDILHEPRLTLRRRLNLRLKSTCTL